VRDCPPSSQWVLGPANRGSSGSRAIDDLSGAETQSRRRGRLQAELRPGTSTGAALGGFPSGTAAWPAPRRFAAPRPRLVARTGRRSAGQGAPPQGHQLREHLPLRLCPDRPHQGLPLATLSAARQEQARLARPARRQLGKLHRGPDSRVGTAACRSQPRHPRPLGSRPDDVCKIRPGRADRARAQDPRHSGQQAPQQAGRPDRAPARQAVRQTAERTAADHHVRQRHRVRPSSEASPAGHQDVLLRSLCALAEGRYRERHRPDAPLPAAQDRPRNALASTLQRPDRRLQQHSAKMP